jgi:hypothetical protein
VEVVSNTALWYSTGLPAVPLRWVLIRDPTATCSRTDLPKSSAVSTSLSAAERQTLSYHKTVDQLFRETL